MQQLHTFLGSFFEHVCNVLMSPLVPGNRIYVLYLASSALIAFGIYIVRRRKALDVFGAKNFLGFLFPKKVWKHPSAWLDVRYFFFHMFIGHFLILAVWAGAATLGLKLASGAFSGHEVTIAQPLEGVQGAAVTVAFMLVLFLVSDFIAFYIHYLQHKVPLLWQFHKVHHSAEVMHPISNFREHPVDNLVYKAFIGFGSGVVAGLAFRVLGYHPSLPVLLGVPVLMFMFNFFGYNLRHSHIWLRWPGVWSKIFPSPAHHHVHHSCHPDHLDKNFAFIFPAWDVLFGTYVMPEDDRDVKFGVTDKDNGHELDSCMKLYFVPFRDAWRLFRPARHPTRQPSQPQTISSEPAE